MGMDLIGYMVKGPVELDPVQQDAAIALARREQDQLRALLKLSGYDEVDPEAPQPEGYDFRERFAQYSWAYDLNDLGSHADLAPKQIVNDLYELWRGGARDTSSRLDPDDHQSLILFAGEGSWGDEPQGFGYLALRNADRVPGLFALLNLR